MLISYQSFPLYVASCSIMGQSIHQEPLGKWSGREGEFTYTWKVSPNVFLLLGFRIALFRTTVICDCLTLGVWKNNMEIFSRINNLVFFGPTIVFLFFLFLLLFLVFFSKDILACVVRCHWPQRGHSLTEAGFPFWSGAREKVILHTIFTYPWNQQWCYITASWAPCRFLKRRCMRVCVGGVAERNNNITLSEMLSGKLGEKTIFIEAFCCSNFLQPPIIHPNIRIHT